MLKTEPCRQKKVFLSVRWGLVTRLVVGYKAWGGINDGSPLSSLKPHLLKSQIMRSRGLIGHQDTWFGTQFGEESEMAETMREKSVGRDF